MHNRATYLLVGVDNAVVAVDKNGQEKWRFTATSEGKIGGELAIDGNAGELIFTAYDRKLYVVSLKDL